MYYAESSKSITDRPPYKTAIAALDRWVAHAYAQDGRGYIELSLLVHKTGDPAPVVESLMEPFEAAGITRRYEKVVCGDCQEAYDPADGHCLNCGAPPSTAAPTGEIRYAVQKPPQKPAFDPKLQSAVPDTFISYRRADSAVLAADLYYLLQSQGRTVFLDDGSLAPGDDAERIFLRAASHAGHFICLVSQHYFESEFCKREIAHAARSGRRLIRVNFNPGASAPAEMPWADGPNWLKAKGSNDGLDQALERQLLAALETLPGGMDLRLEACQYLMSEMSPGELRALWTRLPWIYKNHQPGNSKVDNVQLILQETTIKHLSELCGALAP